jgi:DNA-binding CsgD family transcriptional regulator
MNHAVKELVDALEKVADDDARRLFETWLPAARHVLRVDKLVFYQLRTDADGLALDCVEACGATVPRKEFAAGLADLIATSGERLGFYDPQRPELKQRNVVVSMPPAARLPALVEQAEAHVAEGRSAAASSPASLQLVQKSFRRLGLVDDHAFRVLVCEDDALLCWFGAFQDHPPANEQLRAMQDLIPALQRRLSVERTIGAAPMLRATISALLEALPRAGFIASERGAVLHANSLGQAALDGSPAAIRAALREAIAGNGRIRFDVRRIACADESRSYLVIASAESSVGERVARAARIWSLTPRQAAVLGLVVDGCPNRTIAATLRCAERTIELHVTALLRKGSVSCRAALVSAFFRL